MRAVLDVNVIVSGVLSRSGAPAQVLRSWLDGDFEMVVSPALLDELARVLRYPKIRNRISEEDAESLVELISAGAILADDPGTPETALSSDPDDEYLVSLARVTRSVLVTGDADLLGLAARMPVVAPRAFLDMLVDG
ncbi:MAG: putative toxin-antitoxin system toxin component, PIN family [Acidimicrobiia bacterium]